MIGPKTSLALERFTETDDGMGGKTITWADVKDIKGVLSTIRGSERLSADKKTVIADFYFYMDYPDGFTITEKDRFSTIDDSRKFKITYINDMGANQNNRYKITLKEEV